MHVFKPFAPPIPPTFPNKVFDIRDYGAHEGADTPITDAVKTAIEACTAQGGGRVLIPAGHWFTGPIHFRDNVELHLERGAFVEFSKDFYDYLPVVYGILGGIRVYSVSHFLYAYRCKNIALTGEGILDGHGEVWQYMKWHQPGMEELVRKGRARAPLSERVYDKPEDGVRPRMLQFVECESILLDGITLKNSPSWTVHLAWCKNITVRNVTAGNPYDSCNTDGINLEYCKGGLVEGCTVSGGDDMCCIKAGREVDAWEHGRPCEDIEIRNCRAIRCRQAGVVIGSETSASIRNIYVHDCHLEYVAKGIHIKSMKGRGGTVENIDIERIEVEQARECGICISLRQPGDPIDDAEQPEENMPHLKHICIDGFTCHSAPVSMEIGGYPSAVIEEVHLRNVTLYADEPCRIENATVSMDNVRFYQRKK